MKRLLMVAYHYPPFSGGSGVHRTLKFSRYLPDHGWQPIILTAHPRAYPQADGNTRSRVSSDIPISRAFALDTLQHLSIRRRYMRWMALPDRWASWWLGAVPAGLMLVRKYRPQVLWSTYPIATAHLIGLTLHRLTGLPWVADFRDSMTEDDYPPDPTTRRVYRWIERRTVTRASRVIFTAPSAVRLYSKRYPALSPERCLLIPNGYDEEDFAGLVPPVERSNQDPLYILHSGLIYPEERDPRSFLRAISRLKSDGRISAHTLKIGLRASGSEHQYFTLFEALHISDIVHLLPPLPYREALRECVKADALLVLQGATCNHQIPAKVYEYLRAHRPILALTAAEGDTASLLRLHGGSTIVELSDEEAIYSAVPEFMAQVRGGTHALPSQESVKRYARRAQAQQLAQALADALLAQPRRAGSAETLNGDAEHLVPPRHEDAKADQLTASGGPPTAGVS